jgi:hypothetical protein
MLSPEFIGKTAEMLTLHATVKVSACLEGAVVKHIGTNMSITYVMGQKQLLCMCRSGMYSDRIYWL